MLKPSLAKSRPHLKSCCAHIMLATGLLLSWLVLPGCGRDSAPEELTIAAASSLTSAFRELADAFTEETDIPIVLTFGSTGNLAQQIRNGAPYDVFAAADEAHIDALIEEAHLNARSRLVFATGRLTLAWATSPSPQSIRDLANAEFQRVVIANPKHAPYGFAARQALENSRVWKSLAEKIVFTETVRQSAQILATGNASAGIIALSTVKDSQIPYLLIDTDLHDPIRHVAAISSRSIRNQQAQRFLSYLGSSPGREILEKYGLEPPEAP